MIERFQPPSGPAALGLAFVLVFSFGCGDESTGQDDEDDKAACCLGPDHCEMLVPEDCRSRGGTAQEGKTCTVGLCRVNQPDADAADTTDGPSDASGDTTADTDLPRDTADADRGDTKADAIDTAPGGRDSSDALDTTPDASDSNPTPDATDARDGGEASVETGPEVDASDVSKDGDASNATEDTAASDAVTDSEVDSGGDSGGVSCPPKSSGGICSFIVVCCVHQPSGTRCQYPRPCDVPNSVANSSDWTCHQGQTC